MALSRSSRHPQKLTGVIVDPLTAIVAGDINGDAAVHPIIGAPFDTAAGSFGGKAYVVYGNSAPVMTTTSGVVRFLKAIRPWWSTPT